MTHHIDTSPEAIAALLDGVTPGPWAAHRDPCHFDTLSDVRGGAKRDVRGISSQIMVSVGGFADWKEQEANTRFIAASRELVPALAAEITRLTAELDRQIDLRNDQCRKKLEALVERDEARAQVKRAMTMSATAYASGFDAGVNAAVFEYEQVAGGDALVLAIDRTMSAKPSAVTTAALSRRDAAMRNEGRRQAAELCEEMNDQVLNAAMTGLPEQARLRESMGASFIKAHARIIAALEPEGGEWPPTK